MKEFVYDTTTAFSTNRTAFWSIKFHHWESFS